MAAPSDCSEGTGQSIEAWSESSATAPPTVVMASNESESMVRKEVCNGRDRGSSMDGDTASSSSGPRKRGIKRGWKAGVGLDSRAYVPGRISPLEEALHKYGDRGAGPIIAPRAGLEFDSWHARSRNQTVNQTRVLRVYVVAANR